MPTRWGTVTGGTHLGDLREAATIRHLEEREAGQCQRNTSARRSGLCEPWAPTLPPSYPAEGGLGILRLGKHPTSPRKAALTTICLSTELWLLGNNGS